MKEDTDGKTPETVEEYLAEIKELIQELRDHLPKKVVWEPVEAPLPKRVPAKAQTIKASLIWRTVDIAETALELYERKKLIPAIILTRCLFESTALLYFAYKRIEKVVGSGEMGDIDIFLSTVCLGGRSSSVPKQPDGSRIEAFNILTAIDKLNKKFARYRDNYEFLCDFAHPNAPGAMLAYGHLDINNNVASYSHDAPYKSLKEPEGVGVIAMSISLIIFKEYYTLYEELMPDFAELCDK